MSLRKVLLVDDEPDIRTLVSMILRKLGGLEVEAVASGHAAVACLQSGYAPDLIVLDVMMPEMDGVQTLEAIRALPAQKETPVCFFTAKVHPVELQRWHELGVSDVLSKPFSPALLPKQLQECWQRCQKTP